MKIIQDYENALQAIYNHVSLTDPWFVPIDICTEYFWRLDTDVVMYADLAVKLDDDDGDCYLSDVCYQSAVWRGDDFTVILANDNNKDVYLIFSNEYEVE